MHDARCWECMYVECIIRGSVHIAWVSYFECMYVCMYVVGGCVLTSSYGDLPWWSESLWTKEEKKMMSVQNQLHHKGHDVYVLIHTYMLLPTMASGNRNSRWKRTMRQYLQLCNPLTLHPLGVWSNCRENNCKKEHVCMYVCKYVTCMMLAAENVCR